MDVSKYIDYFFDRWNDKGQRWEEREAKIKAGHAYLTTGSDYQVKTATFPVQVHKSTGDVFHGQAPMVAFLTSSLFLLGTFSTQFRFFSIPLNSRTITAGGNLCCALYATWKGVQKIHENWDEVDFKVASAMKKPIRHMGHALKDAGIVWASTALCDSAARGVGYPLANGGLILGIVTLCMFDPYSVRVFANSTFGNWDIRPLEEGVFVRKGLWEKVEAVASGSFSLLHALGLNRIGNKDTDKEKIDLLEEKKSAK